MLTPDQVRLRLESARSAWDGDDEQWVGDLFDLLEGLLPDLVADMQKNADEGTRNPGIRSHQGESGRYRGNGVWEM
jgi:hypothetical protein